MFISTLFMVAKTLKHLKCPSVVDWIKKRWYIYTMECYSAIRKQILPFVTIWIDLENNMLREINQSEKTRNHMISLIYEI